jgi:hypothetical protein
MSTAPYPYVAQRHALGLPAGSVRAAHVLGIVSIVCAILLVPARATVPIPPYLVSLLFLMIGHFFAAHGVTIATRPDANPSPLYLPDGVVRFLVILALTATAGWKLYTDPTGLEAQYAATLDALRAEPLVQLLVLGGFFVGVMVRMLVGRTRPPAALQDFEAWVSLLALVLIVVAGVIHLIIEPSLEEALRLPAWEGFLGAVIAFYFGERS